MKARQRSSELARKYVHPGLPSSRTLDLVDVFLFLADARIPGTSVRLAAPYLRKTKRVYILAKADLAEPGLTHAWISALSAGGRPAFAVDCKTGGGVDHLVGYLRERKDELDRKMPPGVTPRPIRLMLFGPPNVGKSSLANRLLGTTKAPFGAKPGLTRGSHWLRGRGFLEVLDTPGVVDTSLVKGEARMKLASVWALPETGYDPEEVAFWLVGAMTRAVGEDGAGKTDSVAQADALARLTDFGRKRGFLKQGGMVDLERASRAFIQAFREGVLGRFTLEEPPTTGNNTNQEGDRKI